MQLTWTEVARMLGISRMTLYKRRMELGLTERYTTVSDGLLAQQVSLIKKSMPQSLFKVFSTLVELRCNAGD